MMRWRIKKGTSRWKSSTAARTHPAVVGSPTTKHTLMLRISCHSLCLNRSNNCHFLCSKKWSSIESLWRRPELNKLEDRSDFACQQVTHTSHSAWHEHSRAPYLVTCMFLLIIGWFINMSHLSTCLTAPQVRARQTELTCCIPKNLNTQSMIV